MKISRHTGIFGICLPPLSSNKIRESRNHLSDSKSVCLNGHGGSNPPLSARTRLSRDKSRKEFLAAFAFENMERGTYGLFEL